MNAEGEHELSPQNGKFCLRCKGLILINDTREYGADANSKKCQKEQGRMGVVEAVGIEYRQHDA